MGGDRAEDLCACTCCEMGDISSIVVGSSHTAWTLVDVHHDEFPMCENSYQSISMYNTKAHSDFPTL